MQNAIKFNTMFHKYDIKNAYEELLIFDEKMDPLLNVEIPFEAQGNWDLPLMVINFVVSQLESKKVKISNKEIRVKFNVNISLRKSNSGYSFKMIGIRSNVEKLKKLLESRFLRWYQNRKKIVYSKDIDDEIDVLHII